MADPANTPNEPAQDGFRGSSPRSTRELSEWHRRAPSAEALERELPIVDAHHHLFGAPDDRVHYRIDDLRRDLDTGHRIIGTVYVEGYESGWRETGPHAHRPVGEVEMIVRVAGESAETMGSSQIAAAIVSHADLTLGDFVAEVLEEQLQVAPERLRGIRHRTASDEGTVGSFIHNRPAARLMSDPAFRRGFAQLRRFGLSFDAWIYHTQLDELIDLARAFPDTTIVLDHVGGPIGVAEFRAKRAEVQERWRRGLRSLAQLPNVCVKIGGMGMTVFGFGFEHGERPPAAFDLIAVWQPLIDVCIEEFGTQRCMFESNFPVDKQTCSYGELWNAFKRATRSLAPDERSDLFYRTACRTYRLPELERLADQKGLRSGI